MWLVMIGPDTFIADSFAIGRLPLTGTGSPMTKVRDDRDDPKTTNFSGCTRGTPTPSTPAQQGQRDSAL